MIELLGLGERYRKALGVVVACAGALGKKAPKGLLIPVAHRQAARAHRASQQDHLRRTQLRRPRARGRSGAAAGADLLPEIAQYHLRARRPHQAAAQLREGGLRSGIRRGHRQARAADIPESEAHKYIAGYTILHDVSARDMQFSDKQWYRGKSCDTFAPTGPWIVTADEIPDPHNLRISLTLNGETMQDSNTSNLIFKVPFLISYLSQSVTWEVGDLISTGTPPGSGVRAQAARLAESRRHGQRDRGGNRDPHQSRRRTVAQRRGACAGVSCNSFHQAL